MLYSPTRRLLASSRFVQPLYHFRSNFHSSNSLQHPIPRNFFDTNQITTRLLQNDFDKQQAEAVVNILSQAIKESADTMLKNMVTKVDQQTVP
ncbi:hypothetical protein AYI70_g780 [Smittium culicis]|uniref:Uncharacterized protein n=1 Tax=Smittium culicis TaxID=133412 RepID=A0A1R1YFC9_9FUNG|nr:hypothetical protein AYI70_g8594 [Smittium culicis]OMJ25612.1 hypothetical protein AYI70_g780 [Smittium culicis]